MRVPDALESSVRDENVVGQIEPGTLHLKVDLRQDGFVVNGTVITEGIHNVSRGVITDDKVVDLTQLRILFGVTPGGIDNAGRIRRDAGAVKG